MEKDPMLDGEMDEETEMPDELGEGDDESMDEDDM